MGCLQVYLPSYSAATAAKNFGADTSATMTTVGSYSTSGGLFGPGYATSTTRIDAPSLAKAHVFSVSFWVYLDSSLITGTWWNMFAMYDGANWLRIQSNSTSSGYTRIGVYNNSGLKLFTNSLGNSSSVSYDTWFHFTYVYDNASTQTHSMYINGTLIQSKSLGTVNNADALTGRIEIQNGSSMHINELKVYDYALQPKEIHELSLGLAIHYPLDSIEGLDGPVNKLTSDVNSSSNWTADSGTMAQGTNSTYGYKYVDFTLGSTQGNYRCYIATSNVWTKGVRYIVTLTMWASAATTVRVSRSITDYGAKSFSVTTSQVAYTTYIDCTATASGGTLSVSMGSSTSAGTVLHIRNVSIYTDYDSRINDSTGKGNWAQCNGGMTTKTDTDMGRYVYFEGMAAAYTAPFWIGETFTGFTSSAWFKTNQNSSNPNFYCIGQNSFWRGRLTSNNGIWHYIKVGSTAGCQATFSASSALTDNKWHHVAHVFSNGIMTTYLDGKSMGTSDYTSKGTYVTCSANNGCVGGYSAASEVITGGLYDQRYYVTALTADDISSLYHTGACIANDGTAIVNGIDETGSKTSISLYKMSTPHLSEMGFRYDNNLYVEADGSMWARVAHQKAATAFSSSDTFATGVYRDANRWIDPTVLNALTRWEFIVEETTSSTATPARYRFIQTVNPLTASYGDVDAADITKYGTADGYSGIASNYGGIYAKNDVNTYICANNGTSGNWYGAIGMKVTSWQSGAIPGYNNVTVNGYLDLYVRIDGCSPFTYGNSKASICSIDNAFKCTRIVEE